MSVETAYDELMKKKSEAEKLEFFYDQRSDIQIALYQKFLYKKNDAIRQQIDNDVQKIDLEKISPEAQEGIKVEITRYNTAKANAIYQEFIYHTAIVQANSDEVFFDPQGRFISEVTLTEAQQKEVIEKIKDATQLKPEGTYKEQLKILLGRTPTDTTLCSIDVSGDAFIELQRKYHEKFGKTAIPFHQRASVIASFEETYAHMTLMAKTYERRTRTAAFDAQGNMIDAVGWQDIRQKAAQKIQEETIRIYKAAAQKATSSTKEIDVEKLNKKLGKARTELADFAKKALIEEVIEHLTSRGRTRDEVATYLEQLGQRLDKKHTFTEETATGYDYLHTSDYLQQTMLITGTKDTAHNKPEFKGKDIEDQAAYRQVTYAYKDSSGDIQPTGKVSARIPSPALVFDKTMTPKEIKKDLHDKYGFLHERMTAMRGGKSGPVVEHLFTSFNSIRYENIVEQNNRQRQSAELMIQAMHEFNAGQENNNFLYVQNIGTNRHTYNLGYQSERPDFSGSKELDDITLSSEMALIHSLGENSAFFNKDVKEQIQGINTKVLDEYNKFLQKKPRETYFAQSQEGKQLISEIKQFKQALNITLTQQELSPPEIGHLPTLATQALAKMIATNQHWDKRYGQLTQTLSMYSEWASTGGCKSGNERNQDIMARYSLLVSVQERVARNPKDDKLSGLQEHEKELYRQLDAYTRDNAPNPDAIRAAMTVSVRESNMQGGVASISRDDQGGAAKINSFSVIQNIKSTPLRYAALAAGLLIAVATFPLLAIPKVRKFWVSQLLDTNNAADREMHLNAASASKTQAHKGQDKKTREAIIAVFNSQFKDQPLSQDEIKGLKENHQLIEKEFSHQRSQTTSELSQPNRIILQEVIQQKQNTQTSSNKKVSPSQAAVLRKTIAERKQISSTIQEDAKAYNKSKNGGQTIHQQNINEQQNMREEMKNKRKEEKLTPINLDNADTTAMQSKNSHCL